jgi:hypothetical protein
VRNLKLFNYNFLIVLLALFLLFGVTCFIAFWLDEQHKRFFISNFSTENLKSFRENKFCASINGKLYYPIDSCSNKINKNNIVWFSGKQEAELSGYRIYK